MTDTNIHSPAGELNNARYQLDFAMIPKILRKDPDDFVTRCLREKDGYLCALFNRYYDLVNSVFFFDNPKRFQPSEFTQREVRLDKNTRLLYITLPTEHQGSLVYCTAYALVYEKKFFGYKNVRFFTIERSFGGTTCIGSIDEDGSHVNYGSATGTSEGDIARIREIVFK